jgi:hypothetical protein
MNEAHEDIPDKGTVQGAVKEAAGEEQGDLLLARNREHPRGEGALSAFGRLEYLHRRIVGVHDRTLSRLADQLFVYGMGGRSGLLEDIPLGTCRQWYAERLLQLFQPFEGALR